MSVDEKTGMQALERLHASKPARPGLVERIEFEYHRHGTLCLIVAAALGKDPLNRHMGEAKSSHWVRRDQQHTDPERYRHQF